jgi:predicted RNase H-like nuclease
VVGTWASWSPPPPPHLVLQHGLRADQRLGYNLLDAAPQRAKVVALARKVSRKRADGPLAAVAAPLGVPAHTGTAA